MRDQARRLQLSRLHEPEEHGYRRRVHESRRDRDIAVPECLEMQLYRLPVHAHVRQAASHREDGLTDVKGGGNADRFDRDIDAGAVCQPHHVINSRAIGAIDDRRGFGIEEDPIDRLFTSSDKRLARALLLMARYGEPEVSHSALPRVSQQLLAETVGATRSRVNVFMNKFRRLGFIDYNGALKINNSLLTVVLRD